MHPMNVLLMRTFYSSNIPMELYESAEIDGASQFKVFLNKIVTDIQYLNSSQVGASSELLSKLPTASVRMAIAFVAMVPVLLVFPFLTRFFTKGITMGAVKG